MPQAESFLACEAMFECNKVAGLTFDGTLSRISLPLSSEKRACLDKFSFFNYVSLNLISYKVTEENVMYTFMKKMYRYFLSTS